MGEIRVDVLHRFKSDTPSLRNLRNGLAKTEMVGDLEFHSLRPGFPGISKFSTALECGSMVPASLSKYASLRSYSDCCIVHKRLLPIDRPLLERLFARFDTFVYSTYDAEYVHYPETTRYLFKRADLVYATSHAIAERAKQHTTPESVALIPPSVDCTFFTPEETVPAEYQTDSLVLGWVGNASVHASNLQTLADVLKALPPENDVLFRMLGGGELPDTVRSSFADVPVDVDILDYVPQAKLPGVINSFDIGLAPLENTAYDRGRSSEKVREYMACGCPVIASDVGENPYLVPSDTGILVNGTDDWLDAIEAMTDQSRRTKMGFRAREHVKEEYSLPVIASKIQAELEWIL